MEYSLPHLEGFYLNRSRNDYRVERLLTVQEMLLEYSLVFITLGCFLLLSLPLKLCRGNSNDINSGIAWV